MLSQNCLVQTDEKGSASSPIIQAGGGSFDIHITCCTLPLLDFTPAPLMLAIDTVHTGVIKLNSDPVLSSSIILVLPSGRYSGAVPSQGVYRVWITSCCGVSLVGGVIKWAYSEHCIYVFLLAILYTAIMRRVGGRWYISIKIHEFKPRKIRSATDKPRGPCGKGLFNELSNAIKHRRNKVRPEETPDVYNWEEQVINALPV